MTHSNSTNLGKGGDTFRVRDVPDVEEAVAWANSKKIPLEIVGNGSKRRLGRPVKAANLVDMSAIAGVTLYEADELVLSARAGTAISDIEQLLAENGQELAFEPIDYGPLLGEPTDNGTIGGVLATNLSGPRRIRAGAARDHILGVNVVSGRGEVFKSGGRVVKNVTGYDLSKAMAGSWGTLGIVTDLTFKVLPAAETEKTMLVLDLDDADATTLLAEAMGSNAEVSGAAHLPESVSAHVIGKQLAGRSATAIRIEGFARSVDYRIEQITRLAKDYGESEVIEEKLSRTLWREIRDVVPFVGKKDKPVWRVSMIPGNAYRMVADLRMHAGVDCYYDWQGGLVWLCMEEDPQAVLLRKLIATHGGGYATLVVADEAVRSTAAVFEPLEPALEKLSARLKTQFDPAGILNPGRMVNGR